MSDDSAHVVDLVPIEVANALQARVSELEARNEQLQAAVDAVDERWMVNAMWFLEHGHLRTTETSEGEDQ